MHMSSARSAPSTSARKPLRRLSIELVLIVIAKIAFLTLIWWVVVSLYPRVDTRPAAIEHLLAPSSSHPQEATP